MRGAALAYTHIKSSELMLSITFSYRPGYIRLKIRELLVRNKELSADFMKCSGPILGASLVWGIGFTSYLYIYGTHGNRCGGGQPPSQRLCVISFAVSVQVYQVQQAL
ncbi:MAG: hypothetical protein ACLTLY_07305 [Agathobacter rectalis]